MVRQRIRDPLHDLIEFDTERDEFEGSSGKPYKQSLFNDFDA